MGSWGVIRTLAWCIFVSLLMFRRFRHLIVSFIVINVTFYLGVLPSAALKRPRPFGVDILGKLERLRAAPGARRDASPRSGTRPRKARHHRDSRRALLPPSASYGGAKGRQV
jgi:hypothetical protein